MANTYGRAAGQPGVGGADAPVLICLAAVGGAAVIPGVVDGSGDWPGGCWHRQVSLFFHLSGGGGVGLFRFS